MLTAPAVAKAAIARPILLVREPFAAFFVRVAMVCTSDKVGECVWSTQPSRSVFRTGT